MIGLGLILIFLALDALTGFAVVRSILAIGGALLAVAAVVGGVALFLWACLHGV